MFGGLVYKIQYLSYEIRKWYNEFIRTKLLVYKRSTSFILEHTTAEVVFFSFWCWLFWGCAAHVAVFLSDIVYEIRYCVRNLAT